MNVTNYGDKDRKLHIEGHLQREYVEQKEYAGASTHKRIAENNDVVAVWQTNDLLELILSKDNLNEAYRKVVRNKGSAGIDGMNVNELLPYLKEHGKELIQQIGRGKYKPSPVRRVEIPKEEKGKVRKLGIPTVVDRLIQQAIAQILSPVYEEQFSETSYGFRPQRGAHNALKQCQEYVDAGYVYVVDMDLEKFFDTVNQSKLIEILSRTISDGRVVSLIHKYLNAGILSKGIFKKSENGVPQGGPLSPLLSNIMLNELDKELEHRGHKFIRYADDCMILCRSVRSARRTLENITKYVEQKLYLKVNKEKTVVAHVSKVKYLGYAFYRYKGKCRLRIHPKSILKMKNKLRALTARSKAISNTDRIAKLNRFIVGWINYFKLADTKKLLRETDEWLRRKIRAIYWKQWKKVKTRYKMLKALGASDWKLHEMSNCRKGVWRASIMLNQIFSKKKIVSLGFYSMTDYYAKLC